jgi:hypothetical protein
MDLVHSQRIICEKYGAYFLPCDLNLKIGISQEFSPGIYPINGLRRFPEKGTAGWYIWSGETFSEAPDFFEPIHAYHLIERDPRIVKYLGLAVGWRFLFAPDHEDVWLDENLLEA